MLEVSDCWNNQTSAPKLDTCLALASTLEDVRRVQVVHAAKVLGTLADSGFLVDGEGPCTTTTLLPAALAGHVACPTGIEWLTKAIGVRVATETFLSVFNTSKREALRLASSCAVLDSHVRCSKAVAGEGACRAIRDAVR